MIRVKRELMTLCLVLFATGVPAQPVSWKADTARATIKFVTRGLFGELNGALSGLKATILFDPENPAAGYMTATVDPETIVTGISLRNSHLRNEEGFFNTSRYPFIYFISKQIEKVDSGYVVTGNLTIKTVTGQIRIPFTFEKTATGAVFHGHFTMDARDYTVGSSDRSVAVYIDVPVTR